MTFLPIAQRELRAASRRRSTFRVRWWTALWAIVYGGISLIGASFISGRKVGQILFEMLTFYAFVLCLLAGGYLTSDALSQERREGTLGLLFLTDLKGYDIVLGKLMATSLNAFYCLLALLPVTAFPLLLGGVTGSEFWRMALALLNTLFFSLAAGMFVSTFMRHSERAMLGALFVVLLFGAVLPLLAGTRMPGQLAHRIHPAWVSPFYAFHYSAGNFYPRQPRAFSSALLISNLLGWSFLAGASGLVPYISLENTSGLGFTTLFRSRFKRGSRTAPRATRTRPALHGKNPVLWLLRAGGENRWRPGLLSQGWAL
ncbi:MAG TPA: ABC transporter permease subunit [Verrucomicrobiae bacterium]|nr:ABC transporter permease subunit [Verrucomicrobiae bacterium]